MSLVHVVGRNAFGEFGIGHKRSVPKIIPLNNNNAFNIRGIKCGYGYNIYIDTNSNYFVAGNNQHGECGVQHQNEKYILNPQRVQYFSDNQIEIKHVFATLTGCVTFWITKNNKIYANGWNNKYQLGIKEGNKDTYKEPMLLRNLTDMQLDIVDIKCAFNYSLCLTSNGKVFATAFSKYGGNGPVHYKRHPRKWREIKIATVWSCGKWREIKIKIIQIETGYYHSLMLDENGSVWSCGKNQKGQIGRSHFKTNARDEPQVIPYFQQNGIKIKHIKCGGNYSLATSYQHQRHTAYSWGQNKFGQCGDGGTANLHTPKLIFSASNVNRIQCGRNHSYVCVDNERHFLFGNNRWNQCMASNKVRRVLVPRRINHLFENKVIKDVYLGYDTTYVLVGDHECAKNTKDQKEMMQFVGTIKNDCTVRRDLQLDQNEDEKCNAEVIKMEQEYKSIFAKHSVILEEWNENTNKLIALLSEIKKPTVPVSLKMADEEDHNDLDDEKKETDEQSFGAVLFEEHMQCEAIIHQQTDRLNRATSGEYLLELLTKQHTLTNCVMELERATSSCDTELGTISKQFEVITKQRVELQKLIMEHIRTFNETMKRERDITIIRGTKQNSIKHQNAKLTSLKASSNECISLVHKYNDFMETNKKYIEQVTVYFRKEWDTFESKWSEWTCLDILGWFKYKTKSRNTRNIEWKKIEIEMKKQNICGVSLGLFTENALYMIGIHDFEIRNCIFKNITMLRTKYPLTRKDKDQSDEAKEKKQIPPKFICPITKQMMKDPVIAFDAHTYDRDAIEKYLKTHHKSPITKADAFTLTLFPNLPLKKEIESFNQVFITNNDSEGFQQNDTNYI
eukprot:266237_1